MFGENKKIQIINNAIGSEKFIFNNEKRINKRRELGVEDKFVIGCVGRFEIQKNQKFSVEVFEKFHKKNKDSILLLIGTGSMEDEIKKIVENKGLEDCVKFLGNRKDI